MTAFVRSSVTLVALFASLTVATTARAGSYQVTACKDADGKVNSAWRFVQTGAEGQLQAGENCGSAGEFGGLWVFDTPYATSGADSNGDVSGFWTFSAPTTT